MIHRFAIASSVLMVLCLVSCSAFTPRARISPEGDLPETFSLYTQEPDPAGRWWEEFGDPELTAMVDLALSGNFTIREAWSRLAQARARAVQAGAARYPDLAATAGATRSRTRAGTASRNSRTEREYSLGVAGGYELDLWGRVRSEREAAELETTATREDLNSAAVTLASEIAVRWVEIVSLKMQQRLLAQQLETNLTYLELIELRFRRAMVSALDVYQQKQVVENVRAEIPLVEGREQLLRHELSLLMGRPPRACPPVTRAELPEPSPVPSTGIPADLLAARPDLRAAGLRLRAADRQVSVARAKRLPDISLSANAVYGADQLNSLFETWVVSLAENLTAPLFDAGRRKAEVERAGAAAEEALAGYRSAVLNAVKEVEDALVTEATQREHIRGLAKVISAARRALEEAGVRYRNGLNEYLPVLTQLRTVQELERDLIQQRRDMLIARIGLYRALGGTWPESLAEPVSEPQRESRTE